MTLVLLLGPVDSALAGDELAQAQPAAAPLPMAPPAPYVAYPPPAPYAAYPPPAPYAAYPPPATTFAPHQGNATAAADPSPFYDHWPFWAVFAAAVAGGVVAGVLWARQPTEVAMPTTTFGTKQY